VVDHRAREVEVSERSDDDAAFPEPPDAGPTAGRSELRDADTR